MTINIKTSDSRTFHVQIIESDEKKAHEVPTLVSIGKSLEIVGEYDDNPFTIRMRAASIASFAILEGEQAATISLNLHSVQVIIKYEFYKRGKFNKDINHKFKEDVTLLENLLAE